MSTRSHSCSRTTGGYSQHLSCTGPRNSQDTLPGEKRQGLSRLYGHLWGEVLIPSLPPSPSKASSSLICFCALCRLSSMAHMELRFLVSLGLGDPPGVHLLPCIASSKPEAPCLTLFPLSGQDCYCPETTLVEVPAWPAPLGGSQTTSAFSLPYNGSFHVVCPRKPAESFCPHSTSPSCPLPVLSERSSCPDGHSGTAGGTSGRERGKQGFWGQPRAVPSGHVGRNSAP